MPYVFTPPVVNRVPQILPSTAGVARRLFRYFAATPQGLNLWKMPDGTYLLDQQPLNLSNPDPARTAWDVTAPVITYYGGHTYTVSDAEAAALTTAGFGAYLVGV